VRNLPASRLLLLCELLILKIDFQKAMFGDQKMQRGGLNSFGEIQ
jgi:hypothetical protein